MRLVRWVYLRALGAVCLVAVGSFWAQLSGLIGSDGIWPAANLMKQLQASPDFLYLEFPTLAWLGASDGFLHTLAAACLVLALLLIAGIAPRLVLGLLWFCWLSLVHIGGPFLSFQWDVLLVETLFLSIFFAPRGWRPKLAEEAEPPDWSRFLLQWLAFKVTFSSGVVKLASTDPSWRDLTALSYHYWTQPLATWSSYVAAQWPMFIHRACCLGMFLLELPIAAFALGPRRFRHLSAWGMLTLQAGLAAAGNYSYFNLLAAVLCLPLIDDAALRALAPKTRLPELPPRPSAGGKAKVWGGRGFAAAVAAIGLLMFFRGGEGWGKAPQAVLHALSPFSTINSYGAFAWMSKTRPEIILEASLDGISWVPLEFKYKPGRLDARPGFIAPWQPRLDWQMWFAALAPCEQSQWLLALQWKLLQGSRPVWALMGPQPFEGAPPRFIRSTLWQYHFAPPAERGLWWAREDPQPFCPTVTLGPNGQLAVVPP